MLSPYQKPKSVGEQTAEENIQETREEIIEGWLELGALHFQLITNIITQPIKIRKQDEWVV
jgi:hypothetical protein